MADISLITELDRLHHRASDMRARERQLADAGENDPASDAWKTAARIAASAESEFEIALVEAWPAVARLLREAEQWRARESETQEALQAIGEEFGVRGGEPRVDGIRRVLTEKRDQLAALLREAGEGWRRTSEHAIPTDREQILVRGGKWCSELDGPQLYSGALVVGTMIHSTDWDHNGYPVDGGAGHASWVIDPEFWADLPAPPAAGGKDGED